MITFPSVRIGEWIKVPNVPIFEGEIVKHFAKTPKPKKGNTKPGLFNTVKLMKTIK